MVAVGKASVKVCTAFVTWKWMDTWRFRDVKSNIQWSVCLSCYRFGLTPPQVLFSFFPEFSFCLSLFTFSEFVEVVGWTPSASLCFSLKQYKWWSRSCKKGKILSASWHPTQTHVAPEMGGPTLFAETSIVVISMAVLRVSFSLTQFETRGELQREIMMSGSLWSHRFMPSSAWVELARRSAVSWDCRRSHKMSVQVRTQVLFSGYT